MESSQLPPYEKSLKLYCKRVNWQATACKCSLISNLNVPSPENYGWTLTKDGKLEIQWLVSSPSPSVILEFIYCKCSCKCQLPSRLKYTDECKLQDCTNMTNIHNDSDELHQDNLDSDDESSEDEDDTDSYDWHYKCVSVT